MFAVLASSLSIAAHEEKSFLSYMREKNVFFTGEEYSFRLGIFLQNKRYVQEFNRAGRSFTVTLNKFAHYTPAEYDAMLGTRTEMHLPKKAIPCDYVPNGDVDWREKGVVNPVKDQSACGSCWAFSCIQAQESNYAIYNPGKLYVLSEQNLVDCVTQCFGCNGGWPYKTYDYVISNQGGLFNLESDYPYQGMDCKCQFNKKKGVAPIKDYITIETQIERDLEAKVAKYGPASVAIDAGHQSFRLYHEGIYEEKTCHCQNLNHAVGCVGFGSENGNNYWIIRNSWAEEWGENGYIRIAKNKRNMCGVATSAIIPIV